MTTPRTDAALVPELLVDDVRASLGFWCGLCGFVIEYERPDEGFAYLSSGGAQVMLEQVGVGRNWITASLERPYGRGANLQIAVPDIDPIHARLRDAGHPLVLEPEVRWYRVAEDSEAGVRQFVVADPDGYLIRFQSSMGRRRRG